MICYYLWFHPTGIEVDFFKLFSRKEEVVKSELMPLETLVISKDVSGVDDLDGRTPPRYIRGSSLPTPTPSMQAAGLTNPLASDIISHLIKYLSGKAYLINTYSNKRACRRFISEEVLEKISDI